MPEKKSDKKFQIILINNSENAFDEVTNFLKDSEIFSRIEVLSFSQTKYFDYLEQHKKNAPGLVISFSDSGNTYGAIFGRVRELYPETRRLLVVKSDEKGLLISALNKDIIHFCFALPLGKSYFSELISSCISKAEHGGSWEYAKRVVDEQKIKIYRIAKGFKEKDEKYLKILSQKRADYKSLKDKLKESEKTLQNDFFLGKYLDKKKIPMVADDLLAEFKIMADNIAFVFEKTALKHSIAFEKEKYIDILEGKNQAEQGNGAEHGAWVINALFSHEVDGIEAGQKAEQETKTVFGADNLKADDNIQNRGKADASEQDADSDDFMDHLEQVLEFTMGDDRLSMQITIKKRESDLLSVDNIFEYLHRLGVSYGLISEKVLEAWLDNRATAEPLVVAKGTEPVQPVDGKVVYHFDTDFIHAGRVKEDGSIDFRERGSIPFVEENSLLAGKTPAKPGKPGIDVSGAGIAVKEPVDPVFVAGENTFETDGGLKIFAKAGGQPHLDAMGVVSVAPVLNINSDVDFETGNISFKGSIVVNGTVKEGFKVEGTNLTADQVEGARINLTGDLNVSNGIIDSEINAQGNIQAKYINSTSINTFGDLIITTEILDSLVNLTGKFSGPGARIIGSKIVAKGGIEAGQVGTTGSKPVKLRVGVDDYIIRLVGRVDKQLMVNKEECDTLDKQINVLKKEDEGYFESVSGAAYTQDRTQLEIKSRKEELNRLKKTDATEKVRDLEDEIKELEKKADRAGEMVEDALNQQDRIAEEIKVYKKKIEEMEKKNIDLVNEKKALTQYSKKGETLARVMVNGRVLAGTKIESSKSSFIVRDDTSKCKIEEVEVKAGTSAKYPEIVLVNL